MSPISPAGSGKWDRHGGPALYLWDGAFHFAVQQMVGSVGPVFDVHLLRLDRYPNSSSGDILLMEPSPFDGAYPD